MPLPPMNKTLRSAIGGRPEQGDLSRFHTGQSITVQRGRRSWAVAMQSHRIHLLPAVVTLYFATITLGELLCVRKLVHLTIVNTSLSPASFGMAGGRGSAEAARRAAPLS
jgi:hypothetical protein